MCSEQARGNRCSSFRARAHGVLTGFADDAMIETAVLAWCKTHAKQPRKQERILESSNRRLVSCNDSRPHIFHPYVAGIVRVLSRPQRCSAVTDGSTTHGALSAPRCLRPLRSRLVEAAVRAAAQSTRAAAVKRRTQAEEAVNQAEECALGKAEAEMVMKWKTLA